MSAIISTTQFPGRSDRTQAQISRILTLECRAEGDSLKVCFYPRPGIAAFWLTPKTSLMLSNLMAEIVSGEAMEVSNALCKQAIVHGSLL